MRVQNKVCVPIAAKQRYADPQQSTASISGACLSAGDSTLSRPGRQVLYNSRGQQCGSIVGDVLRKSAHGERHMIRLPFKAWALDLDHVQQAQAAGVKRIEIRDLDDGATYSIPLADFLAAAQPVDFPQHGPQLKVGVGRWHCERPPAPGAPVQLALL